MTYLQEKKRNVSLYLFVMMIGIFGSILVQTDSAADHRLCICFGARIVRL